jgi:hypothetical protein
MTKRKFYKQRISIVVLSEDPIDPEMSLSEIIRESDEGAFSRSEERGDCHEIGGKQAATALIAQGSDPEFFQIDRDGNDVEEVFGGDS